jgi:hypothetical protein
MKYIGIDYAKTKNNDTKKWIKNECMVGSGKQIGGFIKVIS